MLRRIAFCVTAVALLSFSASETLARVLSSQEIQKIVYETRESEEFPYKARVKGTYVNMRAAPSTQGKKVGQISNGEVLVFAAEQKETDQYPGYHCVNLKDGNEGWMFGQFITTEWDELYLHEYKHKFFALLSLEIPLDKQGRPKNWGTPLKTKKQYVSDFNATYWTYCYDGAEIKVCQTENGYYVMNASVEVPGRGFGGIYCGTEWCDQFYVDKHLEGLLERQRNEEGNVWYYDAERFEVLITFSDEGLVKKVEYKSYID